MDNKKKDQVRIPTVSRMLPDGRIVELVYEADTKTTRLAVGDGKAVSVVDELQLSEEQCLVPISANNNLIRHEAVLLPGHPEDYGDVAALVADIDSYINRYVSLSDWFRTLASYYVLLSWLYDAFEELPYLRLQATWGSGKTRALIVLGSLCYRGFFASGASTVSPIFHTLDTFRGTLILDEADFRLSDQTAELTKILNNGNVRGFPVLRTAVTNGREFDPRAFQVFGTKIVAMRKSFDDEALESRFITERLDNIKMRPEVPINLPKVQKEEARRLRNKLLKYRFDHRLDVVPDESLVDPALLPRTNQVLVPLLSIIKEEQARADIRNALLILEGERTASRSATTEAELLEILAELYGEASDGVVSIAAITERFSKRYALDYDRPITNRYIGSKLRNGLGLRTYKTHGTYIVAVSEDRLRSLCARYGVPHGRAL